MKVVALLMNITVMVFSTHFVCKKPVNPCKESVFHHSIFTISVKLGTIVKINKK